MIKLQTATPSQYIKIVWVNHQPAICMTTATMKQLVITEAATTSYSPSSYGKSSRYQQRY